VAPFPQRRRRFYAITHHRVLFGKRPECPRRAWRGVLVLAVFDTTAEAARRGT
jgi:hypothetical protein